MVVIYSDKVIKGLGGVYCSPRLFDGIDNRAEVVYTSDDKIKAAYVAKKIEVKGFPRTSQPKAPAKPAE